VRTKWNSCKQSFVRRWWLLILSETYLFHRSPNLLSPPVAFVSLLASSQPVSVLASGWPNDPSYRALSVSCNRWWRSVWSCRWASHAIKLQIAVRHDKLCSKPPPPPTSYSLHTEAANCALGTNSPLFPVFYSFVCRPDVNLVLLATDNANWAGGRTYCVRAAVGSSTNPLPISLTSDSLVDFLPQIPPARNWQTNTVPSDTSQLWHELWVEQVQAYWNRRHVKCMHVMLNCGDSPL